MFRKKRRHKEPHPRAGQPVPLKSPLKIRDTIGGVVRIEDWADRVYGRSWQDAKGFHHAAQVYAERLHSAGLPIDENVVYAKLNGDVLCLIHISELA